MKVKMIALVSMLSIVFVLLLCACFILESNTEQQGFTDESTAVLIDEREPQIPDQEHVVVESEKETCFSEETIENLAPTSEETQIETTITETVTTGTLPFEPTIPTTVQPTVCPPETSPVDTEVEYPENMTDKG